MKVKVEARHWEGFSHDDCKSDNNPIARAVAEVVGAAPEFKDRLPEPWGIDVLAREDFSWELQAWHRMGEPWSGWVTLLRWFVTDEGACDEFAAIMHGFDDDAEPLLFEFETDDR